MPNELLQSTYMKYNNTLFVQQKHAGFIFNQEKASKIKYIGTWGLGTCVGLALWKKQGQGGMVAHFDSDNVENVYQVAKQLNDKFANKIGNADNIAVIPPGAGDDTTTHLTEALKKIFKVEPYKNETRTDFAMSLKTGKIYWVAQKIIWGIGDDKEYEKKQNKRFWTQGGGSNNCEVVKLVKTLPSIVLNET